MSCEMVLFFCVLVRYKQLRMSLVMESTGIAIFVLSFVSCVLGLPNGDRWSSILEPDRRCPTTFRLVLVGSQDWNWPDRLFRKQISFTRYLIVFCRGIRLESEGCRIDIIDDSCLSHIHSWGEVARKEINSRRYQLSIVISFLRRQKQQRSANPSIFISTEDASILYSDGALPWEGHYGFIHNGATHSLLSRPCAWLARATLLSDKTMPISQLKLYSCRQI